jgi:hypothetical protein
MAEATRDRVFTILAVLFGILALSNFLKPFQFGGEQTGFVFLGRRLSGTANTIVGPLFGLYLLIYAAGMWRMKRYAINMGYGYTAYVVLNLVLFNLRNPAPPGMGYVLFGIVYSAVAIGVSGGAVYLLTERKAALT